MKKNLTASLTLLMTIVTVMLFYSFEKDDNRFLETQYEISQKWELPEVLSEISAIDWIGNNKIAAVQDEDGTLFIYDLERGELVEQVEFGSGGDYEGLRILGKDAYVLRSDGMVLHIEDYMASEPKVNQIKSSLTGISDIDVEGLAVDEGQKRLLLAVKEKKGEKKTKGIYTVDLQNRNSQKDPVFRLQLSDPVLSKGGNSFTPSEIDIHPVTKEYYLLDGRNPKLLIAGKDGKPKSLHLFRKKDFSQPEGITFTPEGTLYISNEADKGPANILQVSLK